MFAVLGCGFSLKRISLRNELKLKSTQCQKAQKKKSPHNHIFLWYPCDTIHTPLVFTACYFLMVGSSPCLRYSFGSQKSEMLILNVKEKFICAMRVVSWHRSCQTEEVSYNCHSIMKIFFKTLWQLHGETENETAYTWRLLCLCEYISLCSGLYSQFEWG